MLSATRPRIEISITVQTTVRHRIVQGFVVFKDFFEQAFTDEARQSPYIIKSWRITASQNTSHKSRSSFYLKRTADVPILEIDGFECSGANLDNQQRNVRAAKCCESSLLVHTVEERERNPLFELCTYVKENQAAMEVRLVQRVVVDIGGYVPWRIDEA